MVLTTVAALVALGEAASATTDGPCRTALITSGDATPALDFPIGLALDGAGNTFVSDAVTATIHKFDATGAETLTIAAVDATPNLDFPVGVAVDGSGNIYVADMGSATVYRFDSTGTQTMAIPASAATPNLVAPQGVALDPAGNIHVSDQTTATIHQFDSTGTQTLAIESADATPNLITPRGIAVDSTGNIYVADEGNDAVHRFDSTGTQTLAIESADATPNFVNPAGVAVDSTGNIYVADYSGSTVHRFDSAGAQTLAIPGGNTTGGTTPAAIAVTPSGDISVTDALARSVSRISFDFTELPVGNELDYRVGLDCLSGDSGGPHVISLTKDFTITAGGDPTYLGAGDLTLRGNGFTIDAQGTSRILDDGTTALLTIEGITLIGGRGDGGGAIRAVTAITVADAVFESNDAIGAGASGGAIQTTNAVTATNSTFRFNTAADSGGAISAQSIDVRESTLNDNLATDGGAVASTGPTISTNSTLTGNSATSSGGAITAGSTLTSTYSTLVDNAAPVGANIVTGGALTSFGTVITGASGGGDICSIGGATTSAGYNFAEDGSCDLTGTGDTQSGSGLILAPLADNGGDTRTRFPYAGSDVIDAIPAVDCDAIVTLDQRGVNRPFGGGCDIGAVEADAPPCAEPTPVATETEYRAAIECFSNDAQGAHEIDLTADITFTNPDYPVYNGPTALTIDGNGHEVDLGGVAILVLRAGPVYGPSSDLLVRDITVRNGETGEGAGGAITSQSRVFVQGSTFVDNSGGRGGAIEAADTVSISNSTFVGNTALFAGGAVHSDQDLFLSYVTLTSNSAPAGSNVSTDATFRPFGSVLADPLGGGGNCIVEDATGSHNLVDDGSCGLSGTDNVQEDIDPLLGALRDNGGPTPTRFPLLDSPLIDQIPDDLGGCNPDDPLIDQRGVGRLFGSGCDIGAVEAVFPPTVDLQTPPDGATYARNQVVNADYSCADEPGGSGIAAVDGCVGTVADGQPINTATLGDRDFTVTATDNAGNTTTVTHTYTVANTRPDARIRRGNGALTGDNIYNTFTGQTRSGSAAAGRSVTYFVSVQNDAPLADTLRLRGQRSTNRFAVRYRNPAGVNITNRVTAGTYPTPVLAPQGTHRIKVTVTVSRTAPRGASLARTLSAASVTQPTINDTVRFVTRRS